MMTSSELFAINSSKHGASLAIPRNYAEANSATANYLPLAFPISWNIGGKRVTNPVTNFAEQDFDLQTETGVFLCASGLSQLVHTVTLVCCAVCVRILVFNLFSFY